MGLESKKRSAKGMHVCQTCDSPLVQPVNWHQGDGDWHVELRCPECECWGRGGYSQSEVDAYDEELDRGVQELREDLRSLTLANMTEEVDLVPHGLRDTAWAMSDENVEVVRRSLDLWLSGEVDAWRETLDPNIGWDISTHPLPDVPDHGRGRDAFVTDVVATYMSGWNDYSAQLKDLIDAGDQVVAVVHETARMRNTDVPLDRDLVHLWTVHGGRTSFMRIFRTKEEALDAARLRE